MPSAAEFAKDRPAVSSVIKQIVENQIGTNEPREAKEALERLMAQGFTEEDARILIGHLIRIGMLNVLRESRSFDGARYEQQLRDLPQLPEEPEVP